MITLELVTWQILWIQQEMLMKQRLKLKLLKMSARDCSNETQSKGIITPWDFGQI